MKRLLLILILTFSFQSWTKADDISDFQIEGMSIGDSLLYYMTNVEIKTAMNNSTKVGKDYLIIYYYLPSGSKLYDYVTVSFDTNDKKYTIQSIRGFLDFPNDIKSCLEKKKVIQNEVKGLFKGADITDRKNKKHDSDKSGESKFWSFDFIIKSGSWISIGCTDWSEKKENEKNWKDSLNVGVYSAEYTKFLREHYK